VVLMDETCQQENGVENEGGIDVDERQWCLSQS
jgi:hypothetical protein